MDPFEAKAMSIVAAENNKTASIAVTAPNNNIDSGELSTIQTKNNRFDAILSAYQKAKTELSKKLLRDVENEAKDLDSTITRAQQTPIAA